MNPTHMGVALGIVLFIGMVVMIELGRLFGRRTKSDDASQTGRTAIGGAVYGLLALLIAFTFSGAATRFDSRRYLIVDEANAIGTAYLRVDLLPPDVQLGLRDLFRRYVDSRIATYQTVADMAAVQAELDRGIAIQGEIWRQGLAGCRRPENPPATCNLLVPALNSMIDLNTTRTMGNKIHPPAIVFAMLLALALITALLTGYDLSRAEKRDWVHVIGFSIILSVTVYVILDIEYPRLGFFRIDAIDEVMLQLRASMK
ncbi:MAG TPA: DUF4239 domain-containing protein [Verrucomicrobiae bacterium]|jgi:hypothetical protein|nr:DUF4239 domain-containing protein [Verrucomicrobiae bacterium]